MAQEEKQSKCWIYPNENCTGYMYRCEFCRHNLEYRYDTRRKRTTVERPLCEVTLWGESL